MSTYVRKFPQMPATLAGLINTILSHNENHGLRFKQAVVAVSQMGPNGFQSPMSSHCTLVHNCGHYEVGHEYTAYTRKPPQTFANTESSVTNIKHFNPS